jgi:hypothetical protein
VIVKGEAGQHLICVPTGHQINFAAKEAPARYRCLSNSLQ